MAKKGYVHIANILVNACLALIKMLGFIRE